MTASLLGPNLSIQIETQMFHQVLTENNLQKLMTSNIKFDCCQQLLRDLMPGCIEWHGEHYKCHLNPDPWTFFVFK